MIVSAIRGIQINCFKGNTQVPTVNTSQINDSVSFGSKLKTPDLKHLWEAGKLPNVKYGFYGDILTHQNISREHLKPVSKKGKNVFGNIVLATKRNNGERANLDIRRFADIDTVKQYLRQFADVCLPDFDGKLYISAVKKMLSELGLRIK